MKTRRYISPSDEARIAELYRDGKTAAEVASEIGCAKPTILNTLRRLGIARRPARPRNIRGSANPNWKGGSYTDPDGYVHVWTPAGHRRAHRVVTGAGAGQVVHHKDHDRSNNHPDNLEVLDSHAAHRAEHVAEQRATLGVALHPAPMPGEANPRAKLTAAQVLEIRSLRGLVSQAELGRRYGVSKTAIRLAQKGKNWSCVPMIREFPRSA